MSDIPNINTRQPGHSGYVAGFNNTKVGIYALDLWSAKQAALAHFKPSKKRAGEVWVVFAEDTEGGTVLQHCE